MIPCNKWLRLTAVMALVGGLNGCATDLAEHSVSRRLPDLIGPARSYQVRIENTRDAELRAGLVHDITIEGRDVHLKSGPVLQTLTLKLHDVQLDRQAKQLQSVGSAYFELRLSQQQLDYALHHNMHAPALLASTLAQVHLQLRPGRVAAEVPILGNDLSVEGRLEIDSPRTVRFVPDTVNAFGNSVSSPVMAALKGLRMSPVRELGELPVDPCLDQIFVEEGALQVNGHLAMRASAPAGDMPGMQPDMAPETNAPEAPGAHQGPRPDMEAPPATDTGAPPAADAPPPDAPDEMPPAEAPHGTRTPYPATAPQQLNP